MAIKSLKELPIGKRASSSQIAKAKKAKAIKVKHRIVGREKGRTEISLGVHKKEDIAGVIKGFRQKTRADIGLILKDDDGNVIARTHIAKGHTTIPEQLAVKALVKYGKKFDKITVVLTVGLQKRKK